MTNFSDNIERARRIIGFYYDGNSTPEDLTWVKSFLCSVDKDKLPEDLKIEAEIFGLIDRKSSEIEKNIPEDLENRIRAIWEEEPQARKIRPGKGVILKFMTWASVAAALVVLLINILPLGQQNNTLQIGGESLAVLINEPDEDGYVEITDAEDAALIISSSLSLAGKSIDEVYTPVSKAALKINKIDDKLNKILNHKSLKAS